MPDKTYKRHDRSDIFIHWFNAACWLLLLLTGVGLIQNPAIDPFGSGYPAWLRSVVGGGANLLTIHEGIGLVWVAGFVLYLLVNFRGAKFFLAEIFAVSPARDMAWMFKKMILMTLGPKALKMVGANPDLPDQGYYNMGQKAFAQASVVGGVVIAATGIIMYLSDRTFGAESTGMIGWAVTLHFIAVGLVFAGLLVHVYMAAISPDERPGFKSMFTGVVPGDYAKHHHRLWWEKVRTESGKGSE
ncbi:cytochrome b/b6 domain-containing protein [Pseudodesulfovibrio thermohalotolerans]|jgi:formate dehydrogenase subunit gamma|uniref:formate dehydrogenase subunit gamma n=1 Tax=Pseudodesulfovibrio thermohalotolerans TaxID=2880651 RepID=UPI00244166C0|nr:cytochrome b/b6 domain-containing protein [Pseudodesulfovibrio thermohalotolerans]WFS62887.1 cytochrome b/b6 domain-containing protein [Pseudodesulfovibrio thermohalotolerans]